MLKRGIEEAEARTLVCTYAAYSDSVIVVIEKI
jgi:hypothetical protein